MSVEVERDYWKSQCEEARAALQSLQDDRDTLRVALILAEDVLSRAPYSTGIWPNGMHPNAGIEKIRSALASTYTVAEESSVGPTPRLDRDAIVEIVMRETTDELVADGWDRLGKPNILVQGCKFVRGFARGYENPEDAARKFAGLIADALIVAFAPTEARTGQPEGEA